MVKIVDGYRYIEEWVESTGSDPESWEIIMVRTKPVEKQQQVTEVIAIEMGWLMVGCRMMMIKRKRRSVVHV